MPAAIFTELAEVAMSEELHQHDEGHADSHSKRVEENAALPDVNLTPKAVEMVRKMRDKEGLGAEQGMRIGVVGGGCSGFQYQLNFDSEKEGDRVARFGDVRVLVDEISFPYIAGTTLDFVEGLHGAGFKFDNPRASRTCGCGSSFSA
jgi:iron-sulfur cluster assembly accessory protein